MCKMCHLEEKLKYYITNDEYNCDCVEGKSDQTKCKKKINSITTDGDSNCDDVKNLMEVCSNYELILEKFENQITAISNHCQNLLSKQLTQEQVLLKEKDCKIHEMETQLISLVDKLNQAQELSIQNNSKIIEMESELITLADSLKQEQESSEKKDSYISEIKFDINDVLKRYQLLQDESCNTRTQHNDIVLKLESKICCMENELNEFNTLNTICNKTCDDLSVQNAKLIKENDNKCVIINNNVKEILCLETIIIDLKNCSKESDDQIAELKTKICLCVDEPNSSTEYQNDESLCKLECTGCQTEITIKQLMNKESEHEELLSKHHKILSEINRISSENSTFCTVIGNLKGKVQELKVKNIKLIEAIKDKKKVDPKQSTHCGIQVNLSSVNFQSELSSKNFEQKWVACTKDYNNCNCNQHNYNNSCSADQCMYNDSHCCCLVEIKNMDEKKLDGASLKEELEKKYKLLLEEKDVLQKTCIDAERKYYNLERDMKNSLDEMKIQHENKMEEFNAQMETYETTFIVNKRDFETYKKQENELKSIIAKQKKDIKAVEQLLKYEENKVISLSNNLKTSEKQIITSEKISTSEKCKNTQLESDIKALTELLSIQINKVEVLEQQLSTPKKRKLSDVQSSSTMKGNCSKNQPEKSGDSAEVGESRSESELVYSQSLSQDRNKGANMTINSNSMKEVGRMEISAGGESVNIRSGYGFSPKLIKKLNFQLDTALKTIK